MFDFYRFLGPVLRSFSPETAHTLALQALKLGLVPRFHVEDPILNISLWGKTFANPLGMAAGFDKNAQVIKGLHQLGFGFVEVGTITPKAQPGNPKPRMFRLPKQQAVINRLGFNNHGADVVAKRLQTQFPCIVGVNIGKNKLSEHALPDYLTCAKTLGPYADYMVINVSSPNTPGL